MASILVTLGLLVVYAKQWLEQWVVPKLPRQQLSIFSAIVICLNLNCLKAIFIL